MSELRHHGILGMKWGVRRFQNKDGSLTPEGRDRYRVLAINTRGIAETTKAYKRAVYRMNAVYKPVKDYFNLSEKERDKYIRQASDADYDRQIDLFDPLTEAKDREKMFEYYKYDDLDQGPNGSFKYYLEDKGIDPHKFSGDVYKAELQFRKDMGHAVIDALNTLSKDSPTYADFLDEYIENKPQAQAVVNEIIKDLDEVRYSIGYWYDLLNI